MTDCLKQFRPTEWISRSSNIPCKTELNISFWKLADSLDLALLSVCSRWAARIWAHFLLCSWFHFATIDILFNLFEHMFDEIRSSGWSTQQLYINILMRNVYLQFANIEYQISLVEIRHLSWNIHKYYQSCYHNLNYYLLIMKRFIFSSYIFIQFYHVEEIDE